MFTHSIRAWSLIVALGLTPVLVVLAEEKDAKDEKNDAAAVFPADLGLKPPATPEQVSAWRKKFAFESLTPRLAYEREHRPAAPLALSEVAKESLDTSEEHNRGYKQARATSLEMLHTLEVNEFISKSGFGLSRKIEPGAQYIEPKKNEPIDFVKLPPLSGEETTHAPTMKLAGDEDAPDAIATVRKLPTRDDLLGFHAQSRDVFAWDWDFGLVKSVDRVSGFQPHAFAYTPYPPVDTAQPKPEPDPNNRVDDKRWHVTRLELVSLLKHATPRVYLSDHLPRMEELSSRTAPTRDLDAFESAALKHLRDGEEIQTSSTPNRIEMLGAVRASKQCMQCHEVPRGALLGAFSYELRRDPPIVIAERKPAVQ